MRFIEVIPISNLLESINEHVACHVYKDRLYKSKLRRIMGKAVSWVLKEDIKQAAGPLQTCASHGAEAEAAIHGMREIFDKQDTDAVLLIDAIRAPLIV